MNLEMALILRIKLWSKLENVRERVLPTRKPSRGFRFLVVVGRTVENIWAIEASHCWRTVPCLQWLSEVSVQCSTHLLSNYVVLSEDLLIDNKWQSTIIPEKRWSEKRQSSIFGTLAWKAPTHPRQCSIVSDHSIVWTKPTRTDYGTLRGERCKVIQMDRQMDAADTK